MSDVDAPQVSVVLPVRNAAATLRETLDSIRSQTLTAYEIVAVDDGSTDASPAILRDFAVADPRIRITQSPKQGLVAALNHGVDESRAKLIARMDADDIMLPRRLELQSQYLVGHAEVDVVGTKVELFSDGEILAGYREYVRWQNDCVTAEEIATNIFVESPFAHPSVMFRKEVLLRVGAYRDGPFPEDYELWLRMHAAHVAMAKVDEVLLRWRESAERTSRVDVRYSRDAFDELRADYLSRDRRLHSGREVVIWGAGRRTRQRVKLLLDRGVRPSSWIDIDPKKIGRVIWELPVRAASSLEREEKPFVLVYVTNHGAREEIAGALAARGYRAGADYLAVG